MYRILCISLMVFLIQTILSGQAGIVEYQIPSPNAASLLKFIDNPVSFYSGTAEINIPVYEIKSGSLSSPVSLSYHATGIKPDEFPSWVGMGWALNVGGVITRKVVNMPDDIYFDIGGEAYDKWIGMYKCSSPGSPAQWESFRKVPDYEDIPSDLATDEYYFNFGNYSGKFVLSQYWDDINNCRKFVALGHPELKIEAWGCQHILEMNDAEIRQLRNSELQEYVVYSYYKGFRITTPEGIRYDFGCTYNYSNQYDKGATEISLPFYSNESWVYANVDSWYLVKISKANSNEEIAFEYERKRPVLRLFESCKYEATTYQGEINYHDFFRKFYLRLAAGYASSWLLNEVGYISYGIIGKIISPIYLSKITFQNGSVNFNISEADELGYDADMKVSAYALNQRVLFDGCVDDEFYVGNRPGHQLNDITINDKRNNIIKVYSFDYNNTENERLRLNKFWEEGNNPYIFSYIGYELTSSTDEHWPYNENIPPLPQYLSQITDYKGFLTDGTSELSNLMATLRREAQSDDNNGRLYHNLTGQGSQYYIDRDNTFGGTKDFWKAYFSNNFQELSYNDSVISGTLGKIEFPTGGYAYNTYEINHADSVVLGNGSYSGVEDTITSENKNAGGIRIKNISYYDSDGNKSLSKSYLYDLGILNGLPEFYAKAVLPVPYPPDCKIVIDKFSSDNQAPMSSTNTASPVVYSKVIEKIEGLSDFTSIIYYYRNFKDHPDLYTSVQINNAEDLHLDIPSIKGTNESYTVGNLLTDCSFDRGQLIAKVYFNDSNEILKKELYDYVKNEYSISIDIYDNIIVTNSLSTQKESGGNIGPVFIYEKAKIYPYRLDLEKKTIINYFNGDSIKEEMEYTYDINDYGIPQDDIFGFPVMVKVFSNEEPLTEIKYNYIHYDKSLQYDDDIFQTLKEMKDRHFIGLPLETKYYRYSDGLKKLVGGEYLTYGNFGNLGDGDSLYYPSLKYTLNLEKPQSSPDNRLWWYYHYSTDSVYEGLEKITEFLKYDSYGNCLELKEKGVSQSSIFNYDYSLPIIKGLNISYDSLSIAVENALNNIEYESIDDLLDYAGSNNRPQDTLNEFSSYLAQDDLMKYKTFMFYTYDPLVGMRSRTDPNGQTTFYNYDNLERLNKILDNNNNIVNQYIYNYYINPPENITADITGSWQLQSFPSAQYKLTAKTNFSYPIKSYSWSIVNGNIISGSDQRICEFEVGCPDDSTTIICEVKLQNDSILTASKGTKIILPSAIQGNSTTKINSLNAYKLVDKKPTGVTFHWSIDDGIIQGDSTGWHATILMPEYCTTTTVRCTLNYCESSLVLSKQVVVNGAAYYVNSQSIGILDDTTNYFVHFLVNEPTGTVYQWNVDGPASIIGSSTDSVANINFYDLGYAEVSCIVNQQGCDPDTTSFVEKIDIEGYFVSLPGISLYTHHWENDPSEVRWKIYEMQQDSTYSQISDYLITQTRGDCSGTYDWYGIYDWSCQSCGEFETDGKLFYYNLGEDPCISFTNNHQYRVECIITVNSSPIYTCPVEFIYNNSQFIEQIP